MYLSKIKCQAILLALLITGIINQSFVQILWPGNEKLAFQYSTTDKVVLNIYENYDYYGVLSGYSSHVLTPVCEDRICFEAEIEIQWDLVGNFVKFDFIPENPLTKLDHIPFTQSDYDKLTEILLDKSPSFIHLRRNELIVKDDTTEVDGISSATVQEVKDDMVAGAIYTCYTLWYIANGGINFKISEHTRRRLGNELIQKMVRSGKPENHHFVVENIDPSDFELFFNEISEQAKTHDSFFVQRILKKIPDQLFVEIQVQNYFLSHYDILEYSSINLLLQKLMKVQMKNSSLDLLVEKLHPNKTEENEKIIRLICQNSDAENMKVLIGMFEMLNTNNVIVPEDLQSELISLGQLHDPLKKVVRRYRKLAIKEER